MYGADIIEVLQTCFKLPAFLLSLISEWVVSSSWLSPQLNLNRSQVGQKWKRSPPVCLRDTVMHGGHWGGGGFLGPVGHRQMTNPSVMNFEHRPSWIFCGFLTRSKADTMEKAYFGSASRHLQASSMQSCRSSARNLHSSGYTQTICSQGGGPCEGFETRWKDDHE